MTLDRRGFVRVASGAAAALAVPDATAGASRPGHPSHAAPRPAPRRWPGYDDAIVIDALGGPIQFNIPQEGLPLRPAVHEAVRASGITALNLTVNAPATGSTDAFTATRAKVEAWHAEIEAHPAHYRLVRGVDDIRRAKSERRLGVILGFQDGTPFEDDLARISAFHADGVRIVQLTYNVQNRLGAGSLVREDAGLTALGREAVAALDDVRVVVDLSHCGPRTTRDGIAASRRAVAITHSGCAEVHPHPRNKDDAALRALAERGGVFGVFLMPFLNASGAPTAADVIAHLEHALRTCGEDHVGIGTDQGIAPLDVRGDFAERFAQVSAQRAAAGIAAPREDTIPYVPELNHPRRLDAIADRLSARGHPDRVIEKVLGANWMRLFGEVWGG